MPIVYGEGMYLRSLQLTNFRGCIGAEIEFQPDVTVLIGENNSGKSTIIDALRLATMPLSRRRNRYFEIGDFSDGEMKPIELTAHYTGLTKNQFGQMSTAYDFRSNQASYGLRYQQSESLGRQAKWELLCGSARTPDPELAVRERITHVYLEPLRNAQRELDSATGSRLANVVRQLIDPDTQDDFNREANRHFQTLEDHQLITSTTTGIQYHVAELTDPLLAHSVKVGFQDYSTQKLLAGLRLKMAEAGLDPVDIASSGSGYANLVFMATVVLELQRAKESELTLFLVEEPEAHLHPQLQTVLLGYLTDQATLSAQDDTASAAGRIQVIATSHSPNIASAVGTNRTVVMKRTNQVKPIGNDQYQGKHSVGLALARLSIEDDERRKIDQYLDVTKAELLFARSPILVEGIAEAVLLPILANHCLFPGSNPENLGRRKAMRGISIISIGSVDFAPYIKLLAQPIDGISIADRLIIVTDRDPRIKSRNRKAALDAIATTIGAYQTVHVFESRYTLEADLMEPVAINEQVLRSAFIKQKPNSIATWQQLVSANSPSEAMYEKLWVNSKFISKGEFAHDVALSIQSGDAFECPNYLEEAIRYALRIA